MDIQVAPELERRLRDPDKVVVLEDGLLTSKAGSVQHTTVTLRDRREIRPDALVLAHAGVSLVVADDETVKRFQERAIVLTLDAESHLSLVLR